jgi:excisionase family DNA binding protein
MQTDAELVTVREAAALLRCSTATIARMIERGELRVLRLGGVHGRPIRIRTTDLAEDMAGWTERTSR